jgi:hypothetical protein
MDCVIIAPADNLSQPCWKKTRFWPDFLKKGLAGLGLFDYTPATRIERRAAPDPA